MLWFGLAHLGLMDYSDLDSENRFLDKMERAYFKLPLKKSLWVLEKKGTRQEKQVHRE
jgi:hypothetical protein